jgi:hypothetical protein
VAFGDARQRSEGWDIEKNYSRAVGAEIRLRPMSAPRPGPAPTAPRVTVGPEAEHVTLLHHPDPGPRNPYRCLLPTMREAVLMVSPKRQKRGILSPTTPLVAGPLWIPMRICSTA